ncbi:hypothetical protein BHE74_00020434 [Ensete ventricosum]|nr:hypothetical protein BHE74_00020434 [Ensete ventricosum]
MGLLSYARVLWVRQPILFLGSVVCKAIPQGLCSLSPKTDDFICPDAISDEADADVKTNRSVLPFPAPGVLSSFEFEGRSRWSELSSFGGGGSRCWTASSHLHDLEGNLPQRTTKLMNDGPEICLKSLLVAAAAAFYERSCQDLRLLAGAGVTSASILAHQVYVVWPPFADLSMKQLLASIRP